MGTGGGPIAVLSKAGILGLTGVEDLLDTTEGAVDDFARDGVCGALYADGAVDAFDDALVETVKRSAELVEPRRTSSRTDVDPLRSDA